MRLDKPNHYLNGAVKLLCRVAVGIAGGTLIIMMLLTGVDVVLRYFFNRPISGTMELVVYMMLVIVALGIGYSAVEKGNVNVDLLITRLPPRTQAIINSFTYLLGLGLFILITRQAVVYINLMIDAKVTSTVLLIPVFPFVIILTFGSALLCLVLLTMVITFLSQAVKK